MHWSIFSRNRTGTEGNKRANGSNSTSRVRHSGSVQFSSSVAAQNSFCGPSVSTLSSSGDIIRSVSEANTAVSGKEGTRITQPESKRTKRKKSKKPLVRKCTCCATDLEVPPELPYFKCSICHTFHDVEDNSVPYSDFLTLERIKKLIALDEKSEESVPDVSYSLLEESLVSCFSSINALNKSFHLGQSKLSYSRPNIDFDAVNEAYNLIVSLKSDQPLSLMLGCTLSLLKRLRKPLLVPGDVLFLLIILENPMFYRGSLLSQQSPHGAYQPILIEILERTAGIMSNCPKSCRHYLLNWFSRFPVAQFEPKVELFNAYIGHRLTSHYKARRKLTSPNSTDIIASGGTTRHSIQLNRQLNDAAGSSTSLTFTANPVPVPLEAIDNSHNEYQFQHHDHHPTRSVRRKSKRHKKQLVIRPDLYDDDWKIIAFVRVLSLLFNANIASSTKIPITLFYNTMVDYTDVTGDFDRWQKGIKAQNPMVTPHKGDNRRILFCQYPFLLSIGAKTEILEHDAKRQMDNKACEAFFGALQQKQPIDATLHIRVHRDRILQESFESLDKSDNDLKKGLRIEFIGEPGIDAGGLKKEWFLLLFRELMASSLGLFQEYDSNYWWFNSEGSFSLRYYKLTGVALGLALYNSTILDVSFPPVMFKKLLGCKYDLSDFEVLSPVFGSSLRQLIDYDEDNFEEVFGLTYVVTISCNGKASEYPLIQGGEKIAVTKKNRQEYVKHVTNYYLEKSVKRQFEALKQGFYSVVGGNALSLFRPEEIELLIRGSPEPIEVEALKSVTKYQHWPEMADYEEVPVIRWFWLWFGELEPLLQRRLLQFVTGSDRIPATGITNMIFRISRIGGDSNRFPISHTCFNQLCLYEYDSKEKLCQKLLIAINESEGFGIK